MQRRKYKAFSIYVAAGFKVDRQVCFDDDGGKVEDEANCKQTSACRQTVTSTIEPKYKMSIISAPGRRRAKLSPLLESLSRGGLSSMTADDVSNVHDNDGSKVHYVGSSGYFSRS